MTPTQGRSACLCGGGQAVSLHQAAVADGQDVAGANHPAGGRGGARRGKAGQRQGGQGGAEAGQGGQAAARRGRPGQESVALRWW